MAQFLRARMAMISALLLCSLASSVYAEFSGKVIGVMDGDSIRVMRNGKAEQVRCKASIARRESKRLAQERSSSRLRWCSAKT